MTTLIKHIKIQIVRHWNRQDFVDTHIKSGLWKCLGHIPGEYDVFYNTKDRRRTMRIWYPIADGTFSVWRFTAHEIII